MAEYVERKEERELSYAPQGHVCPLFGTEEFMKMFPPESSEDLYKRGEAAAAHGYGD